MYKCVILCVLLTGSFSALARGARPARRRCRSSWRPHLSRSPAARRRWEPGGCGLTQKGQATNVPAVRNSPVCRGLTCCVRFQKHETRHQIPHNPVGFTSSHCHGAARQSSTHQQWLRMEKGGAGRSREDGRWKGKTCRRFRFLRPS